MAIGVEHRQKLARLFAGNHGGYMADAVLEGHMGKILADPENANFAILELPSTQVAILAGDAMNPLASEYLTNLQRFSTVFFESLELEALARKIHPGQWVVMEQYAFSSDSLNIEDLRQLKMYLPDGFRLQQIDVVLAKRIKEDKDNDFAEHHGANFASPEDFIERGFGFCVLEEDRIVSVASTFTICDKGMEIQIDTRRSYRGKGLATVVAAYLIVHSLEKNIDPAWDAANKISASLAKKLGYTEIATNKMYIYTASKLFVILRKYVQKVKKLITA